MPNLPESPKPTAEAYKVMAAAKAEGLSKYQEQVRKFEELQRAANQELS